MSQLLSFNFLVILNLFVIVLWPASGSYHGTRSDVLYVIMIIFTVIAVVLDVIYMVLALVH